MKKHLFLTGPAGYGKTEMIKRALEDKLPLAGGLVTARVVECNRSAVAGRGRMRHA